MKPMLMVSQNQLIKKQGDQVYAGTILEDGTLTVETTALETILPLVKLSKW